MDYRHFSLEVSGAVTPLLEKRMEGGKISGPRPCLPELRGHTLTRLKNLDPTYTRILNPHVYKVSISEELRRLKVSIIDTILGGM